MLNSFSIFFLNSVSFEFSTTKTLHLLLIEFKQQLIDYLLSENFLKNKKINIDDFDIKFKDLITGKSLEKTFAYGQVT